ncbi:MAG: hypothetical protein JRG73_14150 [Deltaproteobacteria bacterium]|nr:hypothetical protein [Deltaproteobacteria bacterium]MBW2308065.1 hypothetical protein [Deltaproteobacteria bacterium]
MISTAVMGVLALMELVLAAFFVVSLLTDRGDNFFLGTILGVQFLVLGAILACYIWIRLPAREIVEDREEGLLW